MDDGLNDALECVGRMRMRDAWSRCSSRRPVAIAFGMRTEECRQQLLFSSIHKASSRSSHPAALAWHMLNEIQTLVNMAAIQEKARPASQFKRYL